MKRYKVIKGSVGGFGNKTHKVGDEVTEDMFPPNNAKDLAKLGFLEELKEAPKKEVKETKKEEPKEVKEEPKKEDSNDLLDKMNKKK